MKFAIAPKITEKTMAMAADKGIYAFVAREYIGKLTSTRVRQEIEKEYSVKVVSVNALIRSGKTKSAGKLRRDYKNPDFKVFYVRLAEGQSIPAFNTKETKEEEKK